MDTFIWPTQIQAGMEGEFPQRVRTVQFGDGYKQVAGDGLHPETQSWPITMTGKNEDVMPALLFMRCHITRSFFWTPPLGEPGLWRVAPDSIRVSVLSSRVATITATFEQAFAP